MPALQEFDIYVLRTRFANVLYNLAAYQLSYKLKSDFLVFQKHLFISAFVKTDLS